MVMRIRNALGTPFVLFRKKLHRFVRQHAAGDGNRRKGRLRRDIGARNHDLIDFAGELLHGRGVDEPADAAPENRAPAHRARLAGSIERAAPERLAAVVGEAAADRGDLAMRGRIVVAAPQIATARQHPAIADDHCAERKVAAPGLGERHAHEPLVLGGRWNGRRSEQRRGRRQYGRRG